MTALNDYLEDFYNNPLFVEEYKINFLKNHYYKELNCILNSKLKNFKIGVNKNRKYIFFYDIDNPSYEIIYNRVTNEYYKKIKIHGKYYIYLIDINFYKNKSGKSKCLDKCIIL